MAPFEPLVPGLLRRVCDPARFPFETTAEIDRGGEILGQERAVEALRVGTGIRARGYNLFVHGVPGVGKHIVTRRFLERAAAALPVPPDWCYVYNFDAPGKPRAISLPPGRGALLRKDLDQLVDELRLAIPAAFDTEDYRGRLEALEKQLSEQRDQAYAALVTDAQEHGVAVVRTPTGFTMVPWGGDKPIDPETFRQLPEEQQERYRAAMHDIEDRIGDFLKLLPRWERELRQKVKELRRSIANDAVAHLIDELRQRHAGTEPALAHLEAIRKDILDHVEQFLAQEDGESAAAALGKLLSDGDGRSLARYRVNVIVDHGGTSGAPVVYEDWPSHPNLVGTFDYQSRFGAMVTDFTRVRAGALHRANGGYLILDARKVLSHGLAWDDLKRALRSRLIRIESTAEAIGLAPGTGLDPEPIPLDVKVVLIGEPLVYYLLAELDPDFLDLFKLAADFDDQIDRSSTNDLAFARLVASIAREEKLRVLDRGGVAAMIEHGSRIAGDAEKLSTRLHLIVDLLREADHVAGLAGHERIGAADIEDAIAAQIRRADRLYGRVLEAVRRGELLVQTRGARVGQVNGLSVVQRGRVAFGMPTRITARVRAGKGEIVDIEREVELGGPIHSKGVLILTGFIGERYAGALPLVLSASLVFEQSYGGVEGDSASLAELLALLSALSEVPVMQSMAITGSIDQHGQVQPIGGVNEKIEGFFDACAATGQLDGGAVVIPASNVKHLMLRKDVVAAAAAGKFRVYAVSTVDQAIKLCTGMTAGERDASGRFSEGSVNGRVASRLRGFADSLRRFNEEGRGR